jgi:universal stress protein E
MAKRHSILVVIDPTSEDQPALSKAAEFAEHIDADLALLTCIFDPNIAHVEWVTGNSLKHLRTAAIDGQFERLEQLAEPLRNAGRTVSIKVIWDKPLHEAIVREALRAEPDFVVKDTHHHSVITRALFTNTDWHLIRECPFPLWLVKPVPTPDHATVMAAVDPTHEHDQTAALDRRIIQTAQLFSAMFADRVQLVHVFEPKPAMITGSFPASVPATPALDPDLIERARDVHVNALNTLAADGGFPPEQVHFREGHLITMLPEVASELHANIVIMGAIARSRLQQAIVGNTAEYTLDRFSCDVLIVKPEDFKSPVEVIPPIYGHTEKTG